MQAHNQLFIGVVVVPPLLLPFPFPSIPFLPSPFPSSLPFPPFSALTPKIQLMGLGERCKWVRAEPDRQTHFGAIEC